MLHTLCRGCDGRHPPHAGRGLLVGVVAALALAGCSAADDGTAAYCATVERTAVAMAGTDASLKRPAMAELRDAAPEAIRGDWDVVFEVEAGDPTERDLARGRIEAFEAEHC